MYSAIEPETRACWSVPTYNTPLWLGREHPWCVVIPVINEGERIKSLISAMESLDTHKHADIIIVDGGSTDGSLDPELLQQKGVRGLLVKTGAGQLGAQLRIAYAFALEQGYDGIISIDGNNKDDPRAIPNFIKCLKEGTDFVQGSRYIPGGVEVNTPLIRKIAIKWLHAPILSYFAKFKWTDTTQGYRAYSAQLLLDEKVSPFRDVFNTYELLAYLSYRAPNLGFKCKEIPTKRVYPLGKVPTKITSFNGNLKVFVILIMACLGAYNPKKTTSRNKDN